MNAEKLQSIQDKLDKRRKMRTKIAKKKGQIAIGLGRNDYNGTGLYENKIILHKTKDYKRIGNMNGCVK